jgi:ClpP class serine protease
MILENFLLAKFNNGPVVVSPDSAKFISSCFHAIMQNQHLPELLGVVEDEDNFWYPEDDFRSPYRPYKVKNGILTIPLKGVLLADFPWQMGSYATGYQYVHMAFKRGLSDPDVKGIGFFSDSPGGHL